MTRRSPFRSLRRVLGTTAFALTVLVASSASAVGTRTFELSTLDDLEGGDMTGVTVASDGTVRAGFDLGATPITDATSVWSSVQLSDGSVLVGTGSEGKVFKISGGQVKLAATTGQMAVSSMAVAWNGDVILGTFPEGKLYRLPKGEATGKEAELLTDLEGAEHVWSLAYDAKAKALYAATGPDGQLFRVTQGGGKPQVYYDSDEAHLVSVALAPDGSVLTGSSGKALLYKVAAPGRASVLYDFDADDVKAVAVHKDGTVYAIANKYNGGFSAPKKASTAAKPESTKPPKAGKGELVRILTSGVTEQLHKDDKTHFSALAVDAGGTPHIGTGAEGKVYKVDDNLLVQLVADTEERQIGQLLLNGNKAYVIGSDPAVYHEVVGTGGANAVWTSQVLDAGLRAQFGRLMWMSEGSVEMSTRSGNTEEPDDTWSAWSAAMSAPSDVKSPPGRFVQVRARFNRDPKAVLREIKLHFVTDNARAVITSIGSESVGKSSLKEGVQKSGETPEKPTAKVKLKWNVENPDKDELRFRVDYRIAGQGTWYSALKDDEILTKDTFDWDTSDLPEGTYQVRVEATDELANPPDRVAKHVMESGSMLVDNTPPTFKALALNGRQLSGEAVDGLGPIARIEVTLAGTGDWRPLFPKDLVFDEASEAFDADISSLIPSGSHLVSVRITDSAGNSVVRTLEAR